MAELNGVLAPPPLTVSQWTPLWCDVQLARLFFTLETVEALRRGLCRFCPLWPF